MRYHGVVLIRVLIMILKKMNTRVTQAVWIVNSKFSLGILTPTIWNVVGHIDFVP